MAEGKSLSDVSLKQDVPEHKEALHKKWILRCYELASNAKQHKDHPFGSLLVKNDDVVLEARNRVVSSRDITAHAELNLIREASMRFNPDELKQMTLYSSTEPCVMCLGAIYWAGIRSVVYGVGADELGEFVDEQFIWPSKEIAARSSEPFQIYGPVLADEGMKLHRQYWR